MITDQEKKDVASNWFRKLRDDICSNFENLEKEFGNSSVFERTAWDREGGGGGEMSLMRGKLFEKVGVNISVVHGKFSKKFSKEIPGCDNENIEFWASGISLVTHMTSPFIPTAHFNTRMIITQKAWFGGGGDLTPTFPNEEDTANFHKYFKDGCDKFDKSYYPKFKKECDEYFYLHHRNEPRGVGGIFYDYLNTGNWEKDFLFTQEVGISFNAAITDIIKRNAHKSWGEKEKNEQLKKRGRYVEFNLIHDRGTRFGLMTNGNTEAILMSLPPSATW